MAINYTETPLTAQEAMAKLPVVEGAVAKVSLRYNEILITLITVNHYILAAV